VSFVAGDAELLEANVACDEVFPHRGGSHQRQTAEELYVWILRGMSAHLFLATSRRAMLIQVHRAGIEWLREVASPAKDAKCIYQPVVIYAVHLTKHFGFMDSVARDGFSAQTHIWPRSANHATEKRADCQYSNSLHYFSRVREYPPFYLSIHHIYNTIRAQTPIDSHAPAPKCMQTTKEQQIWASHIIASYSLQRSLSKG
jgi:hypothetical protein